MYVCFEYWRADMKFKQAFFFKNFLRFFQCIFLHKMNVKTLVKCRDIH